jgi:tyrosyl-tRNA synthetase
MSKSKHNYIGVTEVPNTMFAKLMSISDELMWNYFTLLSFSPLDEIARLKAECAAGRNPRDAKVLLGQEIVTRFHGAKAAEDALADFNHRARGGAPDDMPEITLALPEGGIGIGNLLRQAGLVASNGEAARLIEQGGVRVDGSVVSDKALKLGAGTFVVQVGKRKFARVCVDGK